MAIDGGGHDDGSVIVNYPRNKRHSTGDVASEVAPFRSSLLARAAEAAAADSSPPSTAESTPLVTSPPPLYSAKRRLQLEQRKSSTSLPDTPRNNGGSNMPKSQTTITDF